MSKSVAYNYKVIKTPSDGELAITQPTTMRRLDSSTATAAATTTTTTIGGTTQRATSAINNQRVPQQQQQQQLGDQQLLRHTSLTLNDTKDCGNDFYGDILPQREDSLEYFIKFPNANNYRNITSSVALDTTTTTISTAAESDYVFVYKETNVPIVMLLGWAGCQDRYLMKYSKIYEDRGLITIRYTAPVDTLFWKRTAMVPIGEKILKLIYDMNFEAHPLIFHIFSNGGAYLYQHISLAIRKHHTPIQIRGMIFDSAPGERRILGLYRAVTAIYGREKKKCHCLTAIFITFTLSVLWFVEETYAAFKSVFVKEEPAQRNPFCGLKNEPSQFPQMFLYSKNDVVIPYQDIEKFIQLRKQQGVDVSSVCFEDAEHVKIFTKYPSQYIQCVCTFINNCLSLPYRSSYVATPTSTIDSISTKYE